MSRTTAHDEPRGDLATALAARRRDVNGSMTSYLVGPPGGAADRHHAVLVQLRPGGIPPRLSSTKAPRMLQGMRGLDPVSEQRRVMARTHLADIRRLDRGIKANKATIRRAVATAHTTVTDAYGVGPIVAAFLIGFTGDPLRFASADHYAAYNGTAPIEVSSAGKTRHRLSLHGNRRLNHAIHMAAVTQIRLRHPGTPLLRPQTRRRQNQEGSAPGTETESL